MILPNFVILGAPKCGTSTLFHRLAAHPEIAASARKEPFFLMDPDSPLKGEPNIYDDGISAYGRCFPEGAERARVRMEATSHYLFQETALKVLGGHGDIRVCVVLRDPADRVYSSFSYTKHNLARLSADLSFDAYVKLLRANKPLYPDHCTDPRSAFILERELHYSRYHLHLRPWLERLGRERLEIVDFSDLKDDCQAVLERLASRLGLSAPIPDRAADAARNRTYSVRSFRLQSWARRVNEALPEGWLSSLAKRTYFALQTKLAPMEEADRVALEALREAYRPDTTALEDLLGERLSWSTEPPMSSRREILK